MFYGNQIKPEGDDKNWEESFNWKRAWVKCLDSIF